MNINDVNNDGIALDGFDPVAHFGGEPLRGNETLQASVGDLTFYFSSRENLEKFRENPTKYIPIAGSFTTESMVGNINDAGTANNYEGNKTFDARRNLEDARVSMENNVPVEINRNGNLEMQNLHDSDN